MAKTIVFKLQIQGPDLSREITLKTGVTTLGREPGNDIQLNFPKVSRRHARFECTDTMCIIIDQESANGTLVDGARIPPNVPIPLNDNSVVEIDPVKIVCKHTIMDKPETAPEKSFDQQTISRQKAKEEAAKAEKTEDKIQAASAAQEPSPEEKPKKKEADKKPQPAAEEPPPAPPAEPPPAEAAETGPEKEWSPPPGLSEKSIRYLDYLPGIYQQPFMSGFMALFESILIPVEWNVDNFDLYLSPGSAPAGFLPWLSNWYDLMFDASWPEEKRRRLLEEAHQIYARRGTRWALTRLLEIYTDQTPEIVEFAKDMDAHTFKVILKENKSVDKALVTRLIDAGKPAHTSYQLEFKK